MSSDIKIKVQSFGRFLSNMVMPNIGAFIAWGIITALFIPTGWLPNETLAKLVGPMITYLLPLLIGYTGGKLVGGERGGVVGAITTMGVIVGADMPMFLGSMIAGPLGGWCIKHFDRWVDGKIKSGFEMLVNNFSAGIIGMILAILAFLGIGPIVEALSKMLAAGVNFMVVHDMLPLASIFVEPAKILFLNNAINHGIFSPLGIQQSHELGKSIFFLIEANPGPGMGVLLAYMFFGRGSAKQSAGGAAIIHFLGGIHEIYFPYVLMNPRLILAVILGGMTGVFTLTILGGGLVSPASPGSILAVLAMTPKGAYFANIAGVCAAMAVSFVVSAILLKTSKVKEEDDIEAATRRMQDMKAESKGASPLSAGDVTNDLSHVRKIIVACDAGVFMSSDIKIKVQSFGRFLSNMVMPNIGAFIAWGIITALFIPTGWLPNETLAKLVGPMITYLLPLLIGYTGGKLVGGERGGVVGAITTMGVIVGADMPMFLGSMIAGPLGGWCIKHFDRWVDGKIKSGFEMLVNNFSAGIIGMILAILAFLGIGPIVEALSKMLAAGVNFMVVHDMLPLASIFVEPAKILFLNNAINHGIFSPLGIQQSHELGKSIFFLIEANPGPGMGVLLAYMFFGRGSAKQSAGGAAIIHFLGGIHEIYFPYVLMNPRLILAVILGGMTGVFTLTILGGGLVSPASPGSILAVLAMTPKGAYFANIAGVCAAMAVSFVVSAILLKTSKVKEEDDIEAATRRMQDMKAESKGASPLSAGDVTNDLSHVRKIIVACDAGMGSSAMGAGVLRKKIQDAGLSQISVTNSAINNLPPDVDLVITHRDLTERAMRQVPQAQHISLTNFLDSGLYTSLTERLVAAQRHTANEEKVKDSLKDSFDDSSANLFKLGAENIFLGRKAATKEEAIRFAGEQLVKGGYVEPEYVQAMLDREKLTPTYLGESIAVPHGTVEAKDRVLKTGVVFCQYPEGVRFGEEEDDIARLVIGIAARNNEHIQVITSLTNALDDESVIERLAHTTSVDEVLELLAGRK